jgi:CheY-like chemotaxis protein
MVQTAYHGQTPVSVCPLWNRQIKVASGRPAAGVYRLLGNSALNMVMGIIAREGAMNRHTEVETIIAAPTLLGKPLAGLTVLLVEDSRYASDATRLMCLQSGGRLRRADSLRAAHRHLSLYRPGAVMIDIGLPDGSGLDLIGFLHRCRPRVGLVLATSGQPEMAQAAFAVGADGFLAKPVASLRTFQAAFAKINGVTAATPDFSDGVVPDTRYRPDPLALRDDLRRAAQLLQGPWDDPGLVYTTRFIGGLARSTYDASLEYAAENARLSRHTRPLADMVNDRISTQPLF